MMRKVAAQGTKKNARMSPVVSPAITPRWMSQRSMPQPNPEGGENTDCCPQVGIKMVKRPYRRSERRWDHLGNSLRRLGLPDAVKD